MSKDVFLPRRLKENLIIRQGHTIIEKDEYGLITKWNSFKFQNLKPGSIQSFGTNNTDL